MNSRQAVGRVAFISIAISLGLLAAARFEDLRPARPPAHLFASHNIQDSASVSLHGGLPPSPTASGTYSRGTTQVIYWDFDDDDGNFIGGGSWVWGPPSSPPLALVNQAWETGGLGNYPDMDCSSLYSDFFTITDSTARLVFDHFLAIQPFADGGNVQISLDQGQTFILLFPVGGYPYPPPPDVNCPEGLHGPVYSGFSNGYERAVFPIGQYAGNLAILRWVFESDPAVNYQGWIIDNVRIFGAVRF